MSLAAADPPPDQPATIAASPHTLAMDIGGSNVKASVLDAAGGLAAPQVRTPTPKEPAPQAVLEAIAALTAQLPSAQRMSVGFPGVVKGGKILTAPNLGTKNWVGFELATALSSRFGVPTRVLNDAAVQGLGVVAGHGLECVVTLGTGVGCSLFRGRRLLLPLELGQHRARRGKTYDEYIGQRALAAKGPQRWNRRVRRMIAAVTDLTCCDALYIGGGNAERIAFELPGHVRIVSNTAGITGGIRLWDPELDGFSLFRPRSSLPSTRCQPGGCHESPDRRRRDDRHDRYHCQRPHRAHEHDECRQFLPAARGGPQDRSARYLDPCRRGSCQCSRGHGAPGSRCRALVKLGKDARAETVLARLMEEGVSTRWSMRDGRLPTGASVLVSSHERNAAIFTFRGANTLLEEATFARRRPPRRC